MPRKYTKKVTVERKKGEYYEYKREKERIDKKWKWFDKKARKVNKSVQDRLIKELESEFNKLFKKIVNNWYAQYNQHIYDRKWSLKNVSQFDKIWNEERECYIFNISFDSDKITGWHRVSKEYIYINSFRHGWHGGADMLGSNPKPGYEAPHPDPRQGEMGIDNYTGAPYWRFPAKPPEGSSILRWEYWYPTPAYPGTWEKAIANAPFTVLNEQWPEVFREIFDKYLEIFIQELLPYYNAYCEYEEKYNYVRW